MEVLKLNRKQLCAILSYRIDHISTGALLKKNKLSIASPLTTYRNLGQVL